MQKRREVKTRSDGVIEISIISEHQTYEELKSLQQKLKADIERAKAFLAQFEEELADVEIALASIPDSKNR